MIHFVCPACKKSLKGKDEHAGLTLACPACKNPIVLPVPAPAAPPPAVSEASDQWYHIANGERLGPIPLARLQQFVISGKLGPADLVWKTGMPEWVAVRSVEEISLANLSSQPGAGVKPIGGVPPLPATSRSKPTPSHLFDEQPAEWYYLQTGQRFGPISVSRITDLVASGQLRSSDLVWKTGMAEWLAVSSVKELAAAKVESVAAAAVKEPPATAKPAGPLGFFGGLAQQALKNVQEVGAKIKDAAAQRQPAPEKAQPPALALMPPPPRPQPAQDRVDPQTVQKAVPQVSSPSLQPAVAQTTTIAEVAATYQGGHPEFVEKVRGVLRLNDLGLEFEIKDSERRLRIAYELVSNILEPQKGDFPDEMVNTANFQKNTASAMSGLFGVAAKLSGNHTLKMAAGVGKTVASTVKDVSKLGPPPKNRLYAIAFVGGVKHKLGFDVVGGSTAMMEEGARGFWNLSAQIRSRFAKTGGAFSPEDALEQLKGLLDQGILTREQFDQQSSGMGKAAGLSAGGHEPSGLFSSFSTGPPQQLLRILKQLKALTDQGTFTQSEFAELKAIILPKLQAGQKRIRAARRGASDSSTDEPEDDSLTDDLDGGSDFDADEMSDLDNGDEDVEREDAGDESDGHDEEVEEVMNADDNEDYSASSDAEDE